MTDSANTIPSLDAADSVTISRRLDGWLTKRGTRVGWVVFFGCFVLFNLNRSHQYSGDTRAIVDLSWWIAQGHAPRLNGHPFYPAGTETFGYWAVLRDDGLIAPIYPVGGALLVAPAFAFLQTLGVVYTAIQAPFGAKLIVSAMIAFACWSVWFLVKANHSQLR